MKSLMLLNTLLIVGSLSYAVADDEEKSSEAKTVEVKVKELTLVVPESWKQQPPANTLRLTQFEIPSSNNSAEPTECVVSGPFGGSIQANLQRWIDQFVSDGRKMNVTEGKSSQGNYVLLDISGTYLKSIGPPIRGQKEPAEGYQMMGVILTVEGTGNYFLKLVGPAETVKSQAEAFRKSFGAKPETEKPYAL